MAGQEDAGKGHEVPVAPPSSKRESSASAHFNSANMTGAVIADQYVVGRKLGHGAFGHVYSGRSLKIKDDMVAVKVEPRHVRPSLLSYEARIYRHLRGGPGIPLLRFSGTFKTRQVMVTDRLGPSLEVLRLECGGKFSLKSTLMLADQLLARLQFIHDQGFVHRDVKPDNFLVGRGSTRHVVFVIDFGLAKRYTRHGEHIPMRLGRGMTGTPRYASLNNHQGQEQSRRDDLISLAYMLIYFLWGKLPWQGIPAKSKKEKFAKIMELKQQHTSEKLCKGMPTCFKRFLDYCYGLRFTETPNYDFLRALFFGARLSENITVSSPMDLIEDIRQLRRRYREKTKPSGEQEGAAADGEAGKGTKGGGDAREAPSKEHGGPKPVPAAAAATSGAKAGAKAGAEAGADQDKEGAEGAASDGAAGGSQDAQAAEEPAGSPELDGEGGKEHARPAERGGDGADAGAEGGNAQKGPEGGAEASAAAGGGGGDGGAGESPQRAHEGVEDQTPTGTMNGAGFRSDMPVRGGGTGGGEGDETPVPPVVSEGEARPAPAQGNQVLRTVKSPGGRPVVLKTGRQTAEAGREAGDGVPAAQGGEPAPAAREAEAN